jgi:2-iminobutanoate/2-iminopropanoate deaminase
MKKVIATVDAPPVLGPYAQATKVDNTIYVSGQLPLSPDRQMVTGSITAQTERVLLNIQAILEEAEATLDDVMKINIYMTNLDDFDEMNRVFALYFPNSENSRRLPPARSCVEVSRLPKDANIEMDAIAVISRGGYADIEMY